jgi:catechol 2,3-dioxygenase-like lactoylglutathione lyase family enzyme
VKAEDHYHTGIVVEDVAATLEWLSETAGYHWCEPLAGEHVVELAGGERTVPYHFVYSVTEPRLEIIAAQPGTLWQPADSGIHHLGYWSSDMDEDIAALGAAGLPVEAAGRNPDGSLTWAYCRGSAGPRIELVTRSLEPLLSRLWS